MLFITELGCAQDLQGNAQESEKSSVGDIQHDKLLAESPFRVLSRWDNVQIEALQKKRTPVPFVPNEDKRPRE